MTTTASQTTYEAAQVSVQLAGELACMLYEAERPNTGYGNFPKAMCAFNVASRVLHLMAITEHIETDTVAKFWDAKWNPYKRFPELSLRSRGD